MRGGTGSAAGANYSAAPNSSPAAAGPLLVRPQARYLLVAVGEGRDGLAEHQYMAFGVDARQAHIFVADKAPWFDITGDLPRLADRLVYGPRATPYVHCKCSSPCSSFPAHAHPASRFHLPMISPPPPSKARLPLPALTQI